MRANELRVQIQEILSVFKLGMVACIYELNVFHIHPINIQNCQQT